MPKGEATPIRLAARGCVLALGLLLACAGPAPAAGEGTDADPSASAKVTAPVLTRSDIDPAEAARLAQNVAARDEVQTDLPDAEQISQPRLPRWLLENLALILRIVGWIFLGGLVLGLLLLVYLMFADMRFRNFRLGRKTGPEDPNVEYADDDEPLWSRDALKRADELASHGAYDEAIHVLLLGSFGELKYRRAASLPPSLTSREIIARIHVSERAREALSLLIGSVEISHFGGQDVGKPVFDSCRNAFLAFAEPEGAS